MLRLSPIINMVGLPRTVWFVAVVTTLGIQMVLPNLVKMAEATNNEVISTEERNSLRESDTLQSINKTFVSASPRDAAKNITVHIKKVLELILPSVLELMTNDTESNIFSKIQRTRGGLNFTQDIFSSSSVFEYVIRNHDYNTLKVLIDAVGVFPKILHDIVLEQCMRWNDREAFRLLMATIVDYDYDTQDIRYDTFLLSEATKCGKEDFLKDLLVAGVDVNAFDYLNRSLLMFAAFNNNPVSVRILVEAGARIEDVDFRNESAFFYALRSGKTAALTALLELGANVNLTDNFGENVLHKAVRQYADVTRILLEAGIDKETKNTAGRTPVSWSNAAKALRILLKSNVSLHTRDKYNQTPLTREPPNVAYYLEQPSGTKLSREITCTLRCIYGLDYWEIITGP